MSLRVFVPRDAGAVAVGADAIALELARAAAKRGVAIDVVRTGSRGLWTMTGTASLRCITGTLSSSTSLSEQMTPAKT